MNNHDVIQPHPYQHPHKGHACRCIEPKCTVCGLNSVACRAQYSPPVCQHFTGLRQWGINPEPWRLCVTCGWPRAQHQLPSCPAALNIKGEHFNCDLTTPHDGWAHSSKAAQAIWVDDRTNATLGASGNPSVMYQPEADRGTLTRQDGTLTAKERFAR